MSQLMQISGFEKTLSAYFWNHYLTPVYIINLAVSATLTVEEVLAGVLAWLLPLKWSVRRLTGH